MAVLPGVGGRWRDGEASHGEPHPGEGGYVTAPFRIFIEDPRVLDLS